MSASSSNPGGARPNRPVSASRANVERAAIVIERGGLVALPTETVYGLAADATQPEAVASIFAAKGRPRFNPLICHVTGRTMTEQFAEVGPLAAMLIEAFWPGPLTLVLPLKPGHPLLPAAKRPIADLVTAGLDTVAVRAPAHSVARQLLHAVNRPIAAPSANPSGKLSPTRAEHVFDAMGDEVDLILDGGACAIGLESTIVQVHDRRLTLLRPGSITADDLIEATEVPVESAAADAAINAPGQLESHYAPNASIRLDAISADDDEILIGFGHLEGDINLSPGGRLVEAAANLFATLREADRRADKIAVAPIPEAGLGLAINDRLRRAAAPRDIARE